MNLQDNILRILADGPLDFNALQQAVNAISDPRFPWSEEWLAEQVRLMEWRGLIEKHGDSYRVVEREKGLGTSEI